MDDLTSLLNVKCKINVRIKFHYCLLQTDDFTKTIL